MLSLGTSIRTAAAVLCAGALSLSVSAAELTAGDLYRLSPEEFGPELTGICVTAVPDTGNVCLGSRTIRSGDVLAASQLAQLTFAPPESESDTAAAMRYLPICSSGVEPETELVFSIRGRRNESPKAADSSLETYKNLPNEGLLDVTDPEGDALTFTLTRKPRRGEVVLRDDGSFLYTPKKNKVGTDSFAFTATDRAGNVSGEATVTVEILKPGDAMQYADTTSSNCRFEAEWLRHRGLFTGETVNGQLCFSPDEAVSRGQFLSMLMQVLDLPVDRTVTETGFLDDSPRWLRPYLAAALRSGIIRGYPAGDGVEFRPDQDITADEAAAMVQNALAFAVPAAAMDELGAAPLGLDPLTRADCAGLLYELGCLRRDHSGFFGFYQ